MNAEPPKIPLIAKIICTVFLAVLIPVYLRAYGPTNFLWFCDSALILTVIGMWLESSLIISMCAVGILLPQILWLLDFGINLCGAHFLNLTSYMFEDHIPLFTRGLSLFHGWLPLLLLWLLRRVGYDQRALPGWSVVSATLLLICYLFTPPAGFHPTNPDLPININYVYGFDEKKAQVWMNQNLYLLLWFSALFLVFYFPTHLVLRKIFKSSRLSHN